LEVNSKAEYQKIMTDAEEAHFPKLMLARIMPPVLLAQIQFYSFCRMPQSMLWVELKQGSKPISQGTTEKRPYLAGFCLQNN
jgi:hypothetical protein